MEIDPPLGEDQDVEEEEEEEEEGEEEEEEEVTWLPGESSAERPVKNQRASGSLQPRPPANRISCVLRTSPGV